MLQARPFQRLNSAMASLFMAALAASTPGPAIHVPRENWIAPQPATSTTRRKGLGVKASQRRAMKRRNVKANRRAHR